MIGFLKSIFQGIASKEPSIRWLSLVFIVSLGGVCILVPLLIYRFSVMCYSDIDIMSMFISNSQKVKKKIESRAHLEHSLPVSLRLGSFFFEALPLNEEPVIDKTQKKLYRRPPMVKLSIQVFCDKRVTCSYIFDHIQEARDQINVMLTPIQTSELMSREGKMKLRSKLVNRLNDWLPEGKVEDAFITNLVIN